MAEEFTRRPYGGAPGKRHRPVRCANSDSAAPVEVERDSDSSSSSGRHPGVKTTPARPRLDRMPPWKVLLHNDDVNEMGFVIETIVELTALDPHAALIKMVEAHKTGVALLLTAHREYAELLEEQFASKGLTVTIEPDR
jgi:ATP-dependent Clp protease adaptor protein ClpS